MKANAKGLFVYKTRETPDSAWVTLETRRPISPGDTVEHSGSAWRVCYVIEDPAATYAVLTHLPRGKGKPLPRRAGACDLVGNGSGAALSGQLSAVHANLSKEHQELFQRQLRRLVDLYRPIAGG